MEEKIDFEKINRMHGFRRNTRTLGAQYEHFGLYSENIEKLLEPARNNDEFKETFYKIINIYQGGNFQGLFPEADKEKPIKLVTHTNNQLRLWYGLPGGSLRAGYVDSFGHGLAFTVWGHSDSNKRNIVALDILREELSDLLPFCEEPKVVLDGGEPTRALLGPGFRGEREEGNIKIYTEMPISILKEWRAEYGVTYEIGKSDTKWKIDEKEKDNLLEIIYKD